MPDNPPPELSVEELLAEFDLLHEQAEAIRNRLELLAWQLDGRLGELQRMDGIQQAQPLHGATAGPQANGTASQ